MTAELVTTWPSMVVHPVRLLREWLTADEHATGQLTFDDGTGIAFHDIDLPPTPVAIHRGVILVYIRGRGEIGAVAPCTARGVEPEATVVISLDQEPVVLENRELIAKSMPAVATVTFGDGGQGVWTSKDVPQPEGYGVFPDCKITNGVAEPVEAKFVLARV